MKVKFISSTNSAFKELEGKEVNLSYDAIAYFTFDSDSMSFEFRHGNARTSLIKNINFKETSRFCYIITIDANNSTYIFQKGEESNKLPFTKEETLIATLAYGLF